MENQSGLALQTVQSIEAYLTSPLNSLMFTAFSFLALIAIRAYNSFGLPTVEYRLTNARGGFGHAGVGSGTATHAKALLVVIILVLLIPAVALIFTGPTVNSTGVYTNTTVANNARNGITQFSQFIGIVMILGVVGVIIAIV